MEKAIHMFDDDCEAWKVTQGHMIMLKWMGKFMENLDGYEISFKY